MTAPTSRRDFVLALLIAVWAHVGLFFFFAALLVFNLIAAKVIEPEVVEETPEEDLQMQVVYEELDTEIPALKVPQEALPPKPKEEPKEAFVATRDDQAADEAPKDTSLIGERNTTATSDEGAVAGSEDMAALAGEEERKADPKTFDSDFSKGDQVGATDGLSDARDSGKGSDLINQQESNGAQPSLNQPLMTETATKTEPEEAPVDPKDELAAIDAALAALENQVGDGDSRKPVEETAEKVEEKMPERPKSKHQEAGERDGGFATRARKTRVAGVISADGVGSLDVADTPTGRYQAAIFKKLETEWQMENIRNRSLLAPGNITIYFVVNKNGRVSQQRQVAIAGASGTQWGMILRALSSVNIPKMPPGVVKELGGKPLEITVTFNYH